MLERVERRGAAGVRAHPAEHRRQREAGDAHRLARPLLGEDPPLRLGREQVEQLGARDVVDPGVEAVPLEERQRLLDERVGDPALLEHERAVPAAAGPAQEVDAARADLRRRQAQARPVGHRLAGARDEDRDERRAPGQRRGQQRPDLLGLPRGEGDRRAAREVLLQELERLRIGVRGPVLAGLEPGVRADEEHRPVGGAGARAERLGADGVQARGDVAEGREERAVGGADAQVTAERREAGEDAGHRVLADAAEREDPRAGVGGGVPVALGEAGAAGVDARRAEQIGRGDEDRAAGGAVQVTQRAPELAAQRRHRAGRQRQLGRRAGARGRQLPDRVHARGAGARLPRPAVEPLAGQDEPPGQRPDGVLALLEHPAHDPEGLPEALLERRRTVVTRLAARGAGRAARQRGVGPGRQLGERPAEAVGAERVAGAVGGPALDAVAPALERAVDDRGRLAGVERERGALGGDDLAEVRAVGHEHDVPVVEVEQLHRAPLHVVPGGRVLAADAVRVDRGLVPVEVDDDVGERCGPRGGQRLGDAAGGEPALALHDVHARRVGAPVVPRAEGEPDGAGEPDARRAGRQAHEGRRRRRVPVEGPGAEPDDERRFQHRVAAEAEQVLEPEPLRLVRGQEVRRREARDLVAERPERVEPHRLVAGGVGDDVGVLAVGLPEVVVERVVEERGDEPARRDRAAGMARGGDVVEEQRAQRAVDEVERLEVAELLGPERRRRPGEELRRVQVCAAPRAEAERHPGVSLARACRTGHASAGARGVSIETWARTNGPEGARPASPSRSRAIEERHGFPGALRASGGCGGPCRGPPPGQWQASKSPAAPWPPPMHIVTTP